MSEWTRTTLGNITSSYAGGTPDRTQPQLFGGTIPWVKSTEVNLGTILSTEETITELGFRSSAAKWIPANTVVMALYSATAAQVAYLTIEAAANQAVLAIISGGAIDSRFLFYSLTAAKSQLLFLAQGSGQPNLNKEIVERVSVDLPPLPEQRKIARILTTLDELIEKTEALIAKLESVKQGMMHDLFTRGVDEHGHLRPPHSEAPHLYRQSELGWIPKEWELLTLDRCTSSAITYGIVQAGPHVDDGIPYIRTGDMAGNRLCRESMLRTSHAIARSYTRSEVRAGEIVCAIRATVGKVLQVPHDLDGPI